MTQNRLKVVIQLNYANKKCDLNEIWNSIEIELLTDDKDVVSRVGLASAGRPITLSPPSSRGGAVPLHRRRRLVKKRRFGHQFNLFFSVNQQLKLACVQCNC